MEICKNLEKTKDAINVISLFPMSIYKMAELISLKTAGARYGLEIAQPNQEVAKAFDEQIIDLIWMKKKTDANRPRWGSSGKARTSF